MTRLGGATLALVFAAAACGGHDNPNPDRNGNAPPPTQGSLTRADTALVLGPGDAKITNADSSVDMALVGQKIIVKLSDKTMAKVHQQTDTMGVQGSGLGASIEKMVKRTVASTLGQQMEYPLSDVKDARYENGTILIDVNGQQPRLLADTKVGGKKLMESFRPEDAERFVAAVNARKGAGARAGSARDAK
jgi:hypothetical protein